jgi:3-hydroxyacyl-CoA dehydrogenase
MTVEITREGGVGVVTVDNPPVNALGQAVRAALWQAAQDLDADPAVQVVVLRCAGRTFIAGADVREFDRPPEPPLLPDLVARIETAAKPWVAAIHGSALGGGFELALGCRFRVAEPGASVGLPEVTLGIVPGAGGTVRSTRLAGAAVAADLVTTGKAMPAAQALAAGLIDAIATGDLGGFAVDFARRALSGPLPPPARARSVHPVPPGFWETRAQAVAARARGAAAPLRALDCVRAAAERGVDEALAHERAIFLALRNSAEAAALRRIFFAERAAQRGPAGAEGVRRDVREAVVVGSAEGSGGAIASALRAGGVAVTMRDHAAQGAASMGRPDLVVIAPDFAGGAGVAAVARMAISAHPDPADAVVAILSAGKAPERLLPGVPDPASVIALHFPDPFEATTLLEILPFAETAPPAIAAALSLARRMGRIGLCHPPGRAPAAPRLRAGLEAGVAAALSRGVARPTIAAALSAHGFDPRILAALVLTDPPASPAADPALAAAIVAEIAAEGRRLIDEAAGLGAVDVDLAAIHALGFPRWRGGPIFSTGK